MGQNSQWHFVFLLKAFVKLFLKLFTCVFQHWVNIIRLKPPQSLQSHTTRWVKLFIRGHQARGGSRGFLNQGAMEGPQFTQRLYRKHPCKLPDSVKCKLLVYSFSSIALSKAPLAPVLALLLYHAKALMIIISNSILLDWIIHHMMFCTMSKHVEILYLVLQVCLRVCFKDVRFSWPSGENQTTDIFSSRSSSQMAEEGRVGIFDVFVWTLATFLNGKEKCKRIFYLFVNQCL